LVQEDEEKPKGWGGLFKMKKRRGKSSMKRNEEQPNLNVLRAQFGSEVKLVSMFPFFFTQFINTRL